MKPLWEQAQRALTGHHVELQDEAGRRLGLARLAKGIAGITSAARADR
ncbi:MAG: hypothetical protein LC808_45095 [Actinobacteria bacterium]|nr:hypothetical protein [Actinomycetota bacterium]